MRPNNCKVLEAVDEGLVDAKYVMEAALAWMSDDEIKDMCLWYDILIFDEDEDKLNTLTEFKSAV